MKVPEVPFPEIFQKALSELSEIARSPEFEVKLDFISTPQGIATIVSIQDNTKPSGVEEQILAYLPTSVGSAVSLRRLREDNELLCRLVELWVRKNGFGNGNYSVSFPYSPIPYCLTFS